MDYASVKLVHQATVVVSLAGFAVRGGAALAGARWVRSRAARTLPHLVDTALLVSAIVLAWMLRLSPGAAPWLMAKIVGLLVYIGLGIVAMRAGVRRPWRITAWLLALATAAWIVSVAITKNPWGLMSGVAGMAGLAS